MVGAVHVQAMSMELRLPQCRSLKQKRSALRPIIDGARHRYPVAIAEVDHQDRWQRSVIAVAAVASSARTVTEVLDDVERFVWSRPDVEVGLVERTWLEHER